MADRYPKEKNEAIALARLAGAVMMHYYDLDYERSEKEHALSSAEAVLTEVDLKLDRLFQNYLADMWPGDALLTEETKPETNWHQSRRIWIVDPLDGTLGFVKKTGSYGVSIALVEDGRPVVGVLYAPVPDLLAVGSLGGGTELNGKPVDLSGGAGLRRLIVSSNSFKKAAYVAIAGALGDPEGLKMESVVMKTITLLAGEGELYPIAPQSDLEKSTPKFWDLAAADLLVNEAGGRATDFAGDLYRYNRPNFKLSEGALLGTESAHLRSLPLLREKLGPEVLGRSIKD